MGGKLFGQQEKKHLGKDSPSLHHTTRRFLSFEKKHVVDKKNLEDLLSKLLDEPSNESYKSQILSHMNSLIAINKELTNEELLINRMERKAHWRNIIFRGFTTLIIGFSIMLVYWVAHYLEIPMPMLRMPV